MLLFFILLKLQYRSRCETRLASYKILIVIASFVILELSKLKKKIFDYNFIVYSWFKTRKVLIWTNKHHLFSIEYILIIIETLWLKYDFSSFYCWFSLVSTSIASVFFYSFRSSFPVSSFIIHCFIHWLHIVIHLFDWCMFRLSRLRLTNFKCSLIAYLATVLSCNLKMHPNPFNRRFFISVIGVWCELLCDLYFLFNPLIWCLTSCVAAFLDDFETLPVSWLKSKSRNSKAAALDI